MAELDVSQLISVKQAMEIIDAASVQPRIMRVNLESALGLRLAEDLRADRDSPPFDKSLMDGYAVHSQDLRNAPCDLSVSERIMAGQAAQHSLMSGETMAIMTGAPLPAGADAVVPIEQVEILKNPQQVRFLQPVVTGSHIAFRGSEMKAKNVVLKKGDRLGPAHIAVAANIGAATLATFARPSVGVLSTGDELVEVGQSPIGAQIRASNGIMLATLLRQIGCNATDLGIVRDDPTAIRDAISSGLRHDLLLISGGMSVGEKDFIPRVLRDMGADMKITKLRIKPGKPFVFAEIPERKFVFGLPGNPISAFVCTFVLVRRLLEKLSGGSPKDEICVAELGKALGANGPREFYQPSIFDGRSIAPLGWQGSADIFTLAQANALLIRPENDPARPIGEMVNYLPL